MMFQSTLKRIRKLGPRSRSDKLPNHNAEDPFRHLITVPRYQPQTVQLLGKPFLVADGMSFYYSHQEIFEREIYRFQTENDSPRIIDCGSNYGTSIVYFKQRFPAAQMTGVEADPDLYFILQQNMTSQGLSDVHLISGAVASSNEPMMFYREGADSGRVHPNQHSTDCVEIPGVLLDELIGAQSVDFLKMDIEGAEVDVLSQSKKLNQVQQIFVEYHSFVDAPQQLDRLLATMTGSGFRYYIQTQFCPERPLIERGDYQGMDLQLNVFGVRV